LVGIDEGGSAGVFVAGLDAELLALEVEVGVVLPERVAAVVEDQQAAALPSSAL
jgi:hypothetical protein